MLETLVAYMVHPIISIMSSAVELVRQARLTESESENDSHSGLAGQQSTVCG